MISIGLTDNLLIIWTHNKRRLHLLWLYILIQSTSSGVCSVMSVQPISIISLWLENMSIYELISIFYLTSVPVTKKLRETIQTIFSKATSATGHTNTTPKGSHSLGSAFTNHQISNVARLVLPTILFVIFKTEQWKLLDILQWISYIGCALLCYS